MTVLNNTKNQKSKNSKINAKIKKGDRFATVAFKSLSYLLSQLPKII
jgi:hypothetical protein